MNEPSYIVIIPGVLDGRAHIAGRRITVHHVVMWHDRMAMSPKQIASTFEIPLPAVHAALEHYRQHRAEIDREIEGEARWSREHYLDGYRQDKPHGEVERAAEPPASQESASDVSASPTDTAGAAAPQRNSERDPGAQKRH